MKTPQQFNPEFNHLLTEHWWKVMNKFEKMPATDNWRAVSDALAVANHYIDEHSYTRWIIKERP